jgi:Domain of unknown function (DUF4416)
MGTAREPAPVKLVVSLLTGHPDLLAGVKAALSRTFGPTDMESEILPFEHTDYYAPEFGPDLQRQFVTFERLIAPDDLPAVKRYTNELEQSFAQQGRRLVNIDPGYVSLSKLVLATTKDHAHRLYLGQGIYGEVTLAYQQGRFRPWPWTYSDYASDRYCALFMEIRKRYKAQIRG